MARDRAVEQRLLEWAQWVSVGQRGDGYPVTNVLHESWLPPAPGTTPTLKVASGNEGRSRQTHQAIASLSVRLANTVVVHYYQRLPLRQQAERLQCGESTVHARIEEAHRLIRAWLGEFYEL